MACWEDALNPPVTKDGYKTTNTVDAEDPQSSSPQSQPQSPQNSVGREMASPSVRANGGDGHTPGPSTPSASSSGSIATLHPVTPTTPSNRSRFMKSNATPEATAAALAKRKQLIEATIAKTKADAAADVSTSSASSSQPQPPRSKSGGGFTPKPSTPIVRQSHTNNDTTSMDLEDDNDVDMDIGSNRGDTTPIKSRLSEARTLPKGDEGQDKVSIDEGGSPRKRARGSETGVRWDDSQEDNPFAGQRARPLFPEYELIDSPSRGSTAQVDEILSRPADASSGPSTSRATTSMGPPPTTPGGPKTPSSTNTTTESHIMNLESLTEHLRLLERRRVAAERQSEIRQKRIGELEEENRELKLEVERLKLERDEQHAKLDRDEGRITELLLDLRRLKGKAT
ncbi:hypothetical protein FRC05_005617 [Tulasnella sp. 425]|nr:hypothetical protein FRC05_005617 [Tulasnella sp. 425]